MTVVLAQPDVLAFVMGWLATLLPSSSISDMAVDAGILDPSADPTQHPRLLIEEAGALHHSLAPAYLPFRVTFTVYARTENQAATYLRKTIDLINRVGPVRLGGVWLGKAVEEVGPQPRRDPDTAWPARFSIVSLYMPDVTFV